MKKAFLGLLLVVSSGSVAAEAATRYLITTRLPAKMVMRELNSDASLDSAEALENVDTIIADMTPAQAAALRHNPRIRTIEEDRPVSLLGVSAPRRVTTTATGALLTAAQERPYGIDMVRAPLAWKATRGAGIKLGIIDTGIDATHPDLAGRVKGGYDFVDNDNDPSDENGHGTHVAGTIAAQDNNFGVVGVAPDVDLYALRVLDANGSGSTSSVVKALDWAIENHLNIVSLSLGSSEASDAEQQAFQKAADNKILAIAASGNDYEKLGVDGLSYPAGYPTVVSVGAIDEAQGVATFSQRGSDLSVVAPGVSVDSTFSTFVAEIKRTGNATITANRMDGSPMRSFSGNMVFCGIGNPSDFPASVAGKIALIERGTLNFSTKSKNAKAAGAIAAIIFNNISNDHDAGDFSGTLFFDDKDKSFSFIPTVSVSRANGLALQASLSTPIDGAFRSITTYAKLDGTSMATPHVSGVAALLWAANPNASYAQIRNALLMTARDLGNAGRDNAFGNGVVDAFAGARMVAPGKYPVSHRTRAIAH